MLHDGIALGRETVDLSDPKACATAIWTHRPAAVINAAAYTAVDRAESEEGLATLINGTAPGTMASACAKLCIPFIQISTDYVFSGEGELPRRPEDPVAPLGAYGRSKLAGEDAVRAAGGIHAILRTSWVFSAHGHNFVKTMLRLGRTKHQLRVVGDQVGGPTPARAIAQACLSIANDLAIDPSKTGTYHLSGAPDTSWAGFAREIFAQDNMHVSVDEISSTDYPTPARRPLNSRLDCSATQAAFGVHRPDWRKALLGVFAELNREECSQ
jgi:dTDP-4-dehydrorhamnose reductase